MSRLRAMNSASDAPIQVFVLHVKKGYEAREQHMRSELQKHRMDADWVLDHDIPDLNAEFLAKWFRGDMQKPCAATSCAAKHLEAWQRLRKSDAKGALVLEDDIFLDPNFRASLQAILRETSDRHRLDGKPYVLSLENSLLRFVPKSEREDGRWLYPQKLIRCAGAYYLSREAAIAFTDKAAATGITGPADWWMNEFFPAAISLYWSHPTLAEQGSHNGLFKSGIDQKKQGFMRRLSWNVQRWFKTRFRSK